MTVSVIIPVYQAERFVENAVQSACEQKEVSEVILIEDYSTDNSLKLCEELTKKYSSMVKLFQHKDGLNHGAGASRNLGIKKSKGKFIAFLDADDFYLTGRFRRDIEILQTNPDIDGIYNALGVHFYDDEERERIKYNLTTMKHPVSPEKLFDEMNPVGVSGYFHCDTLTVRKEVFEKVGFFDESLEMTQDTQMWFRMASTVSLVDGDIYHPVAMRGVHNRNRVKDKRKFDYYMTLLFISLLSWAEKENIPMYRKRLLWDCLYRANYNLVYSRTSNKIFSKIKIFFFLISHGITKPYLLIYRKYILSLLSQKRGLERITSP